jgi:L-ornithine N5-oxygenase
VGPPPRNSSIYDSLYEQSVEGGGRLSLDTGMQVTGVGALEGGLRLSLDGMSGRQERDYERVILATGYTRELDSGVLHGLARFCDDPVPGRDYRLPMAKGFLPAVFVQGYSEPTHGLSDTLLSVLALRSQEIASNLSRNLEAQKELLAAE